MKTCTKCKQKKDKNCYYVLKTGKRAGYIHSQCKSCVTKNTTQLKKEYSITLVGQISHYKGNAKHRGFTWELTDEEAALFWQVPCTYCGNTINRLGIDRVDNSIGYKLSNCVPCCTMCNKMKLNYDKDTWLEHIERILKHQGRQ